MKDQTIETLIEERKRLIEAMRAELSQPLRTVPTEVTTGETATTREPIKIFGQIIIPEATYKQTRTENVPKTISKDFAQMTDDEVRQAFASRMARANSLLEGEGKSFLIPAAFERMKDLQKQIEKNYNQTLAATEALSANSTVKSPSQPTPQDLPDNNTNFAVYDAKYTQVIQTRLEQINAKIAAKQAERAWGELYTAAIGADIESSDLVNWDAITAKVSELGSESELAKAFANYGAAYNKVQEFNQNIEGDNKPENASQYDDDDNDFDDEIEEEEIEAKTPAVDPIAKLKKDFAALQDVITEVTIANEVFEQLKEQDKQAFIEKRAFNKEAAIESLDGLKGKEKLYKNLFTHGENAIHPLTDLTVSEQLQEMIKTKEDLVYNVSPTGLHQVFSLKSPPKLLAVFEEEFLKSPTNTNLIKIITLNNKRTDDEYLTRIREDLKLDDKAKVPEALVYFYKQYDDSHSTNLRPMVLKNLQQLITKTCMRDGKINEHELNNVLKIFNKTPDNSPRKKDESDKDFVRRMAISDPVRFNKRSDLLVKSGVNLQGKFTTNMAIFTNEDVANILKTNAGIPGVITHVEVIRLTETVKPKSSWIPLPSLTKNINISCMMMIDGKGHTIEISQKDFKKLFHTKTHQEISFENDDLNKNFGLGTSHVFSDLKLEDMLLTKPKATFVKKVEPSKTMGDVEVVKTILSSLSSPLQLEGATIEVLTTQDLEQHKKTPRLFNNAQTNTMQNYDTRSTDDKISIKIGVINNGKTSNYIYEVTPKELKALFSEQLKDHTQISTNTSFNQLLGTSVGKSASR